MTLKIDREADALYLHLDGSPVIESEEVSPGIVLDFNGAGQVVGGEILELSGGFPTLDVGSPQVQTG